jgi:hypothetical protein
MVCRACCRVGLATIVVIASAPATHAEPQSALAAWEVSPQHFVSHDAHFYTGCQSGATTHPLVEVHYHCSRQGKNSEGPHRERRCWPHLQVHCLSSGGLRGHCQYPAVRVPPRTSFMSSQGAECASTRCHTSCGSGSRLPDKEGSSAITCPVAPDPTSPLGRASVLPRVPRLWSPPPCSGGLRRCNASRGSLWAMNKEMLRHNGRAARLARYRDTLTCYQGPCKTCE